MKTKLNKKDCPRSFQKGDLVLMWNKRNERVGKHGNFEILWLGPCKIEYFASSNSFYLSHLDGERLPLPMNGKILKILYQGNI
jgi:hypothetical protein